MPTAPSPSVRKAAFRTQARAARRATAKAAGPDAARRLCANALAAPFINEALARPDLCVALYAAIEDEIDPSALGAALAARGVRLCLPVVEARGAPLIFRAYQPGDETAPGPFGIAEPLASAPALTPDIIFAPLLAFDRAGGRLGYGGGYYDRTLARQRAGARPVLAVGLAYGAQEFPEIPMGPTDRRLDGIVTEREAVYIAR